jgi:hypothetical protein
VTFLGALHTSASLRTRGNRAATAKHLGREVPSPELMNALGFSETFLTPGEGLKRLAFYLASSFISILQPKFPSSFRALV